MLGGLTFFARNRGDPGAGQAEKAASLYLYLSDFEWQAQIIRAEGQPVADRQQEDCSLVAVDGESRIEAITARMMKQLGHKRKKNREVGELSILLDDPDVIVMDNLADHIAITNVGAIRKFGTEQVNCDEVSFGFASFERPADRKGAFPGRDIAVYGFIDAHKLRAYLAQLDWMALNTVRVVPVSYVMVAAAFRRSDTTYCGLNIGAYSTRVVVVNALYGAVTIRVLPVGVMTLADALAKANSIRSNDALEGLGKRDRLSRIPIGPAIEAENGAPVPSVIERTLGPLVRQLGDEIAETLQFFDDQRAAGRPTEIEVYGPAERIAGLTDWLGRRIGLPVTAAPQSLIDSFIGHPVEGALNLLEGAQGAIVTVGKVGYKFSERGFTPEESLAEGVVSVAPGVESARDRGARSDSASRQRGRAGGRTRNPGERGRTARSARGSSAEAPMREGPFMLSLAVIFVVVMYGSYYNLIKPKSRAYDGAARTYASAAENNAQLRNEARISDAGSVGRLRTASDADKVLWTEKFLALAKYMKKSMWLTDVYLSGADRTVDGVKVSTKKLTLEGAVLPSTEGHILAIAEYIERLEADKDGLFMKDFGRIDFEGASVDAEEIDEVVRFTIEALYDKNKRLESGGVGKDKATSTSDQAMQSVKRREALTRDLVPNDGP